MISGMRPHAVTIRMSAIGLAGQADGTFLPKRRAADAAGPRGFGGMGAGYLLSKAPQEGPSVRPLR